MTKMVRCQCGNAQSPENMVTGEVLSWGGPIGQPWPSIVHRLTRCGPLVGPGRHVSKAQLFPDQLSHGVGRHTAPPRSTELLSPAQRTFGGADQGL